MEDAVLIISTAIVGIGLVLILWWELRHAGERRRVGPLRDTVEVLLPIVATVFLIVAAWVA
jgi:UPF0716 family protein affecting phage T7 exclusion